jgi:hypothetical protein
VEYRKTVNELKQQTMVRTTSMQAAADCVPRDVPLFVEHCEAVAAEIDIKRRWLGEQGYRGSSCLSGVLPEQHVTLEVACEPSVVGSL